MERIAALTEQAVTLRRRLYASLPWGWRLANLFVKLSLDTIETFGRTVGAFLLRFGVEGLPDPGPGWNPKVKGPERTLPASYLRTWSKEIYGALLRKYRDPGFVDDVIVSLMLKLVEGKINIDLSMSGKACLSYLATAAFHEAVKLVKMQSNRQRGREDSLHTEDDEGGTRDVDFRVDESFANNPNWLENPNQFRSIEKAIPPHVWEKVVDEAAAAVHLPKEDLHIYFDALADGKQVKNIIDEGLMPHFTKSYQWWKAQYEPTLIKVIRKMLSAG